MMKITGDSQCKLLIKLYILSTILIIIKSPPPLDYPSAEDTDDTDTYNDYKSQDGRYLRDSGGEINHKLLY